MQNFKGERILSILLNSVFDRLTAFASEMLTYSRFLGIVNRLTDIRFTVHCVCDFVDRTHC